ncbi:MAG: aminopeptidase [Syntrophothermus sp.]
MENIKEKMINSASEALKHLINPSSADKALILSDTHSQNIASAFSEALRRLNCGFDSYLIEDNLRPLKEIPEGLEKLLHEQTIVLNIIRAFPDEIPFRIKWIQKVEEIKKIKMAHMPGITERMMLSSVNVDYNKMRLAADRLLNGVENAVRMHITTAEGTDISLGLNGRDFISDIGVKEGRMCNIPCGEIYCAPLETEADGVIVFNASIGDIGLLQHPLKVFVSGGKITGFESEDADLVKRITELTEIDADARMIGELGIGVNPGAHITGNMLEDEKAPGTAHIAFGNNEDFPSGGKNRSQIHRDYLFYRPTIEAEYKNGQKKFLIREGGIL